jgi:hypothetical protein
MKKKHEFNFCEKRNDPSVEYAFVYNTNKSKHVQFSGVRSHHDDDDDDDIVVKPIDYCIEQAGPTIANHSW